MKKVLRIDSQGYFIGDVVIEDDEVTPGDCIERPCPEGFYRPRWNGVEWVEGMTQEEIDKINNQPYEASLEERNRADIDYMALMLGVEL